jgi:hypothetical protein
MAPNRPMVDRAAGSVALRSATRDSAAAAAGDTAGPKKAAIMQTTAIWPTAATFQLVKYLFIETSMLHKTRVNVWRADHSAEWRVEPNPLVVMRDTGSRRAPPVQEMNRARYRI